MVYKKIILKVKSARVVYTAYRGNLKTVKRDSKQPVRLENNLEELIHFNHISNAMHVLLGSRPVSTRYSKNMKRAEYIDNLIKTGFIRYDNDFKYEITTKDGEIKTKYYYDFTQGKKPFYNSNRKTTKMTAKNGEVINFYLTWDIIFKKSIYSPQYTELYNILNEFGTFLNVKNIRKSYSIIDLLILIRDNYPEWSEKICAIKKISIISNFLKGINKDSSITQINDENSPNKAALCNINAVTPKITVDATIILYLPIKDAENLINGQQFATILDGGLFYLENKPTSIRDLISVSDEEMNDEREHYLNENFIEIKNLPFTV